MRSMNNLLVVRDGAILRANAPADFRVAAWALKTPPRDLGCQLKAEKQARHRFSGIRTRGLATT
jgi:hypothetical protein